MSELTFIGLANYTMGTTNFANIIFTSNNNLETSYVYQFNTSSTPNNNWVPLSTLTNVIIIANTEINIQLTIPSTITGNYYVFIKSTSTNTSIWQQSSIGNVTLSTVSSINTTGSYSTVMTFS